MAYGSAGCLQAQDNGELLNRMKAMEARIQSLETELKTLKGEQAALTAAVTAQPTPPAQAQPAPAAAAPGVAGAESAAQPSLGGLGGAAAKALNPDISVIGDFLGAAGYGANTEPRRSKCMRAKSAFRK